MKKLFAVLAIAGVMISCKDKKTDEKKTEDTTTTTPITTDGTTTTTDNTNITTTTTTTKTSTAVPSFSDPEVQKFANDYAAFIAEYKAGMKDPSKLADLSKKMQDWSSRSTSIGTKLATTPGEAQKWSDWVMALNNELLPQQ